MQQALYRKYRPKNFEEVLGQDHIVSVLKNEAKTGKIAHAYLFSGSRGTGKTTIARIFANELDVNPEDIYEIDAASNRGIDEIREIRDAVHTLPYSSKYKVYIVDEAHMLTREAWNAFLKTLEEPPAHVLFIMATTEQHKLPDTVVSRCESFVFRKPTHQVLATTISRVAEAEGYKIAPTSSALIATLADGSFRDALSILQKAISSSRDKELSESEIGRVLGAPKQALVLQILSGLSQGNSAQSLDAVAQAGTEGGDMEVLLKMLIRDLRFILLLRFAKDSTKKIRDEVSESEFAELSQIAKSGKNINSKTLLSFLEALSLQKFADTPELPIELAIIECCTKES